MASVVAENGGEAVVYGTIRDEILGGVPDYAEVACRAVPKVVAESALPGSRITPEH